MRGSRGFTFVELLIGVTVSAVIMTGVVVFVGSGIDNAFKIRKGIEENAASADFDFELQKLVAFWGGLAYSGTLNPPYGTGAVFLNGKRSAPVVVLAVKTATGLCDAYSGTTDVSWTGETLEIAETYAPFWAEAEGGFQIDHVGHVVKNAWGNVILGTAKPWYAGGNGWSALATELRYPSALGDFWADGQLVADAGNDRILQVRSGLATTFLWPEDGIRHPMGIASDGEEIRISMPSGTLRVIGNPTDNGSTFSGSFASDAGFAFDSVRITLGWARIPPSSISNYAFDFGSPTWSVTVSGSAATVSFSWSVKSYAPWETARIFVSGIATPAVAPGAYQATLQYFSWAVKRYERTVPYFVRGDGDPLTKNDNGYSFEPNPTGIPIRTTYEGGAFAQSPLADYPSIWETAPKSNATLSKRLVKDFSITATWSVVTVSYGEYVRYDCLWGNHTVRNRVFKIPLE